MKKTTAVIIAVMFIIICAALSGCGENETVVDGVVLEVNTGGTYSVAEYRGTSAELVLPASFEGKAVTEIADNAFYGNRYIVDLKIPEGVTKIGKSAFRGCTSLKNVTIPSTLDEIGKNAFYDCAVLSAFCTEPGNTVYKAVDGVLYDFGMTELKQYPQSRTDKNFAVPKSVTKVGDYAFYCADYLESVTFQTETATEIGRYAFGACEKLSDIEFGGVTKIDSYAFEKCTSLTTLVFPDSVTDINENAFLNCSGVEYIELGKGMTGVNGYAFSSCTGLLKLVVGKNTKTVDGYAFYNCAKLRKVYFYNSIETIRERAFSGCTKIEAVFYENDAEAWDNVKIEKGNTYIDNAKMAYKFTLPQDE